jgi:hypothetical protein
MLPFRLRSVLPFGDPLVPWPMQLFAAFVMLAVASGFLVFFVQLIRGIGRNVANARAPFVERQARVVTKRTEVWGDNAHTYYYVTFEFADGERAEYTTSGEQFGLLAEGDVGRLVTQGTAFRSFERGMQGATA